MASGPGSRNVAGVTSVPSRMRLRLAGQGGERHPGVGRAGQPVALAHRQVVVGAEERVEAELLGGPGDRQQVVVGRALLGLGEDAQVHATAPTR